MIRHRQGVRLLSVMVLAACLSYDAVPCAVAAESAATLPILGVDPLASGVALEYHQDALPHWVERGFSGAVLLHVDAGDGLHALPAESMAALQDLSRRRDIKGLYRAGRGGEGRLYDAANFVRVAAGLGIVREVVWITPFSLPDKEAAGRSLVDYLGRAGLSAQESGTFHPVDGCYRGRVGEIPLSLCGQERLPALQGPVLLSIDANFFLHAASDRGLSFPTEMRQSFIALRAARYAVQDAVFSYSVQGGEVPANLRWVGEMAVQVLQDPSIVLADNPPERWSALQVLSTLGASEQRREMLGVVLAHLEKQPHDPAFLLYAAEATGGHGGGEKALAYAEEACRMDRGYCVGLREVGLRFFEGGDVETGLRFFAAGEKLLPGMEYGQLDLGIGLMKAGKVAEALAALDRLRELDGAFPSAFLTGAIHLFRGDRAAARIAFDAALAAIERRTDVQIARPEIAPVIAAAAAFYREEGLERQAVLLEGDQRLRLPAPQAAPGRE